MNDDARSGTKPADDDIHVTAVPESFKAFAEEVRKRNVKPRTAPVSIPQRLQPAEFNTAMVHFYRGEVSRSNVWRNRLDATTNWAVITAGATLSFVFSSPDNPHFAIPINTILVSIFLFMEARRYRYYEVWANRVRILETGYFAPMLSHQTLPPDKEWADHISADLIAPHFTISEWEAVGRRLRANYLWIFILLALSWALKIYIHPSPIPTVSLLDRERFWEIFFNRAQVGLAPGWLVILGGAMFNLAIFFVAFSTLKLRDASSEVLPLESFEWHPFKQVSEWAGSSLTRNNPIRRSKKARQRMRSVHKTEG
jgi:Predicted integral membrane protein